MPMRYTAGTVNFTIKSMSSSPDYICPLCQSALHPIGNSLRCDNNHSFDFAKEGYVHLLPVQMKKSLAPGDDKNMVLARREFLALGHYQFLRDELAKLVSEHAPKVLVDLGCGEGYYTSFLQQAQPEAKVYGVDISKPAIKYAAKRNKQVHYSVATNAHLPFSDDYVDVIANVFAPLVGKECRRILKPNGKIITVTPAPQHLFELKQAIYDSVLLHEAPLAPEGFIITHVKELEHKVTLETKAALENLLLMTPFGWKISPEKKNKLLASIPFSVTLNFYLSTYI